MRARYRGVVQLGGRGPAGNPGVPVPTVSITPLTRTRRRSRPIQDVEAAVMARAGRRSSCIGGPAIAG
jgi:hypothetical protein